MVSRPSLILPCFVFAIALGFQRQAQANVDIEGDDGCVDLDKLRQEAAGLLADPSSQQNSSHISIRVRVQTLADHKTQTTLEIVLPDSSLGLHREYELAPQDCASANALLMAVVSEFLEELPAKRWSMPVPNPVPVDAAAKTTRERVPRAAATSSTLQYRLEAASLAAIDASAGNVLALAAAELGAGLGLSSGRQTLWLGAHLRGSTSHELGAGRFRPTTVLGEVGWSYGQRISWALRGRGGAVRIAGSGFEQNFARWLPWVEAGVEMSYRWHALGLRATALASPLRHQIAIENRDDALWLPRFRIGIGIAYWLGEKKL